MITKLKKDKDKLGIIRLNCYKLFLCNLEMKYLFEEADEKTIFSYNSDSFLRFCIESIHIRFCLLASILISENEEYSMMKFINECMNENESKREVWTILYGYDFQLAWKKVKKLRDKCYAHHDKQEERVRELIQLSQRDRNIITNGLVESISVLYRELKLGGIDFTGEEPGIKAELEIMEEYKSQ
ncbi:MAG TPA: hypothetical protein VIK14_13165 [Ignavibacteria bacterium]